MGKRKRESAGDLHETTWADEDDEPQLVEVIPKKKKKEDSDANGTAEEPLVDVWLVRKPKNVSLEELQNIWLPRKIKNSNREQTFDLSDGQQLDATFEKPSKSMYYFQAQEKIQNLKDNKKLRISSSIKGIATLRPHVQVEDPFPSAVEEAELDVMGEEEEAEFPFEIKPIRRQPACAEGPDRGVRPTAKPNGTSKSNGHKKKKPKRSKPVEVFDLE